MSDSNRLGLMKIAGAPLSMFAINQPSHFEAMDLPLIRIDPRAGRMHHRTGGQRARKRWKQRRAAGMAR